MSEQSLRWLQDDVRFLSESVTLDKRLIFVINFAVMIYVSGVRNSRQLKFVFKLYFTLSRRTDFAFNIYN